MASDKKNLGTEKRSWYNDRYEFVRVQRNVFALVTLLALGLSICAIFAVSQLVPLKTVEPFVIQIDQKTGATQVVRQVQLRELSANEALNQYFIVQYCRARESFGGQERNWTNYSLVRVLSDQPVFYAFQRQIALSNPDSPGARLGSGGLRQVQIGTVKFMDEKKLADGHEVLRYIVKARVTENGSGQPKVLPKIIWIEFKYTELELSTDDRYLNPLGFRVTSYQVDDDSVTQ